MSKRNSPPQSEQHNKKQKQEFKTPTKSFSEPNVYDFPPAHLRTTATILKEDLCDAILLLKFVDREDESYRIINTLVENKKKNNLSDAKLVSLFQTYGIGKTTLVRRFREVYDHLKKGKWSKETEWVKDLELFELDFRLFRVPLGKCITNMSKVIADFVIEQYEHQFITNAQPSLSQDLLQQRKHFHQHLLLEQKKDRYYGANRVFKALNNYPLLPEGYLVFFDEVDSIISSDFYTATLTDAKWMSCNDNDGDLYLRRFQELWNEAMPLLIPNKSAVIFSGHIPVHQSLTENRFDYCLLYLSPIEISDISTMLEESIVKKGNSSITLLDAFKLLGLDDIEEFIKILVEYTGNVPRIMENSFNSILHNLNNLSSNEKICEAFDKSDQQDITTTLSNNEEANLVAHLCLLHSLKMTLPPQMKLYFNKRYRNFIEILPHFKIHFQVIDKDNITINIPKLLKDNILKKLSEFKTSISQVRYTLLQTHSIVFDVPKVLELSVIDMLVEQILIRSFTKTTTVTLFGDLCGGIFKETFFSCLELPPNFMTHNTVIPRFSPTGSIQQYNVDIGFKDCLALNYNSFISVLDNAMNRNEFCAAIPGEVNSGFDALITLRTTPSNLLRKLLLFNMKLYEEHFDLTQLQEEINQAANFLPNNCTVEEMPSLHGENLHFTLIMVVMGYSNDVKQVIENNSNKYGSLLITGTCYLENGKISYTQPSIGAEAWLTLKGGFEVLLLSENGLKNLLSNNVYMIFYEHRQKKDELYRKMICRHIETFQTISVGFPHTSLTTTSSIGSSQMHANQQATNFSQHSISSVKPQIASDKTDCIKLQRTSGKLKFMDMELDKGNLKSWKPHQIRQILTDTDIGVGLHEEQLEGVKIYGSDLENVVDGLITFCGNIDRVVEEYLPDLNARVAASIVIWIDCNIFE